MITFYDFEFDVRVSPEKAKEMAALLNALTDEQKEAVAKYGEHQYWEGHDAGSFDCQA